MSIRKVLCFKHFLMAFTCRMAPMPRNRQDHACGLVVDPENGPEIVVAGGLDGSSTALDSVDIYNVNSDSWREGNVNHYKERENKRL